MIIGGNMKISNRGFTLVELLAAIVLLAIIASVGTYSITNIIKASKQKNYQLLIKNIKSAAEVYYDECKYTDKEKVVFDLNTYASTRNKCHTFIYAGYNGFIITLGDLVTNGYLTGNSKEGEDGDYTIVNPNTNESISECYIGVGYVDGAENGGLVVRTISDSPCPLDTDYVGN